jgi:hypothetical protein
LKGDRIKMKMKKLLSMGAIGLVLACSTSIGASATTTFTEDQQEEILTALIGTYMDGGDAVKNLDINEDTAVSSIFNEDSDYYVTLSDKLDDYTEGNVLLTLVDNEGTVGTVLSTSLVYIASNEDNFDEYKSIFTTLAEKVMDINDTEDATDRQEKEEKVIDMIDSSYGTVKFGKNSDGETTVSLEDGDQQILQLSYSDAETLIDLFSDYDTYTEFKEEMETLGLM